MEEMIKEILSQMQVMSNKMEKRFNELENKQDETNHRLTKIETKIENETNEKIQALYEDREIVHSKLDNITNDLIDIKGKITDHDIKIQVISNKTKAI